MNSLIFPKKQNKKAKLKSKRCSHKDYRIKHVPDITGFDTVRLAYCNKCNKFLPEID